MKGVRIILLIGVSLVLIGCNNKKLEAKVNRLEKQNKELRDSIKELNYSRILSSEMVILPTNSENKGLKFDGMLYNKLNQSNFNLYQLDTLHYVKDVEKKEVLKNHSSPQFQIEVDKALIKNNVLYLLAEFDLDSVKVQVPGVLYLKEKY